MEGLAVMNELMTTVVGRFRLVGFLEGLSFLVLLLVAMPLKYLAGEPGAVRVVGAIHGMLFLAYVLLLIQVWADTRWPLQRIALLFIASLLPGGTFFADYRVLRQAR
jgi:integral membrane protein